MKGRYYLQILVITVHYTLFSDVILVTLWLSVTFGVEAFETSKNEIYYLKQIATYRAGYNSPNAFEMTVENR